MKCSQHSFYATSSLANWNRGAFCVVKYRLLCLLHDYEVNYIGMLYLSCVVFDYCFQFEPVLYTTLLRSTLHATRNFTTFKSTSSVIFDLFATVTSASVITVAISVTLEPWTVIKRVLIIQQAEFELSIASHMATPVLTVQTYGLTTAVTIFNMPVMYTNTISGMHRDKTFT